MTRTPLSARIFRLHSAALRIDANIDHLADADVPAGVLEDLDKLVRDTLEHLAGCRATLEQDLDRITALRCAKALTGEST